MRFFWKSLKMFAILTLLTGFLYPLLITAVAQISFPHKAQGSLISKDDQRVGSLLIGQKFEDPKYFWGRPSAVDYNPLPSGGSNLGPTSSALKEAVEKRKAALRGGEEGEIPVDLLFASGSGLDPHISPQAAQFQVNRVAKNRGIDPAVLVALIKSHTEGRSWGVLGEPRVNVLRLNLALDDIKK
jgi:K+-transporting ATPase ATPase C chain